MNNKDDDYNYNVMIMMMMTALQLMNYSLHFQSIQHTCYLIHSFSYCVHYLFTCLCY